MYDIHDKIVLRTPRFGFDSFSITKIQDERFLESLYLASTDLADVLLSKNDKKIEAALPALAKYLSRSSFRCTPYGLFAGVSVVKWGNSTDNIFGKEKRYTRLDMQYIHEIAKHLSTDPRLKSNIKYTSNNSAYAHGTKLRYLEFIVTNAKRFYNLSEVDRSEELEGILKRATIPVTITNLVNSLSNDEISFEEAEAFVHTLIDNQLLISELEPAITGADCLTTLIETLHSVEDSAVLKPFIKALGSVDLLLKKLDQQSTNSIAEYKDIFALLDQLAVPYQPNRIFQVDMFKPPVENSLNHIIQRRIRDGLNILTRLTSLQPNERLEKFKANFRSRYESREMPLMKVVDTESGIGYPDLIEGDITPLTGDVTLPPQEEQRFTLTKINRWLMNKLHEALFHNRYTVNISKEEVADFEPCWNNLPASFSVMFRVTNFADNEIYLESVGNPSAIGLLGRFAYADEEIAGLISDIVTAEQKQNPEMIYAEIVHIPENRLGNIVIHPSFYQYEIPCLSKASVAHEYQLSLQDLYIRVDGGRIKLISKKLNKEIVPRLSNAHNYTLSEVAVYRFLCDLQSQHSVPSLTFNWGPLAQEYVFLPRVTHGKTILHLATWNMPKAEFEKLTLFAGETPQESILEFRKKWKIPRYIVLAERDNELFIDFENSITVKAWIHSIRTKQRIRLKEFLFDQQTPIRDNNGEKYINQFIASAIRTEIPAVKKYTDEIQPTHQVQRIFIPGSEWASFKYYCSAKAADRILTQVIKPLAEKLLNDKIIKSWFFIRYKDDKAHLRVRFRLTDAKKLGKLLSLCNAKLDEMLTHSIIWKVQIDTYEREIERYGFGLIEYSEEIFFHDSMATVTFLSKLPPSPEDEEIRWQWGLRSVDQLLNDFNFPLTKKIELTQQLKNSFAAEFKIKKPTEMQLDKKYRKYKTEIETTMSGACLPTNAALFDAFTTKSKEVKSAAVALLQSYENQDSALNNIIQSHIHMSLNRLLQHSHRFQEMIIYDFMYRYYRSQKARGLN